MTRTLTVLDRAAGIVLAVVLIATGLLALDWHFALVLDLPDTLRTGAVDDAVTSAWWPWVFAGVAVVLGLVGLRWLVAHLGRPGESRTRLATSNETGRLTVDLGSLASVAAERLEQTGTVTDVRGRTRTVRGRTLVELRGHVGTYADVDDLIEATGACVREVSEAFDAAQPSTPVTCRVLLSAPRSKRAGRADRVRVS